jgi:hypothetical protein
MFTESKEREQVATMISLHDNESKVLDSVVDRVSTGSFKYVTFSYAPDDSQLRLQSSPVHTQRKMAKSLPTRADLTDYSYTVPGQCVAQWSPQD